MLRKVITSAMEVKYTREGQRTHINATSSISRKEVNYYSLYWDGFIVPSNTVIGNDIPFERDLMDMGLLERPKLTYYSSEGLPEAIAQFQVELLENYRKIQSSVDWSLHFPGETEVFPLTEDPLYENLRFELLNSLPVPDETIELADILEFKARRKDELDALHAYIDDIYLQVLKSPDVPLLKAGAYSEFEKALRDINSLSKESWKDSIVGFNFSFDFSSPKDVAVAFLGAAGATLSDNKYELAIGLAAAGISALNIKKSKSIILNTNNERKNISFLASAYKENMFKQ